MKIKLICLIIFCTVSCGQKVPDQKLVLQYVINSHTTNGFFKEKEKIPLVANKLCIWEAGRIINIGKKRIEIISPDSTNNKQVLQFVKYQVSDNIIEVEMYLFRENILFQGKYRKHKDSLRELSSNVIFFKKPIDGR